MTDATTLYELVQNRAARHPEALAIAAPGRVGLSYRGLLAQIDTTIRELNQFGIGRHDRVASVLPDSPESAVACVAICCGATFAPLSPSLTVREFDLLLPAGETKGLILLAGTLSPARDVARERGIPIYELVPSPNGAAGTFTLNGASRTPVASGPVIAPDDIAVILRSSGTTARPKVFALTHQRLLEHGLEKVGLMRLTDADRCLNLFTLFHTQGITQLSGILVSGSSMFCVPGLQFPDFFAWLDEFRPTWYGAMPLAHAAIVDEAPKFREAILRNPLRFVRSAASTLTPAVRESLETIFGVPVIESLGSTESRMIAKTRFPPVPRKYGSLGIAEPFLVIIDERGETLPAGTVGELAIPASLVLRPENPEDEYPTINGWYKTGDVGYLDDERYLFLKGRAKELINHGGEHVVPQEVEEQLLRHPAVARAVVFAIPDERLGNNVGAAVVFHQGASATEAELRAFLARDLARYKIPSVILSIAELLTGETGKVQRIGLADRLKSELDSHLRAVAATPRPKRSLVPPRDDLEQRLVHVWEAILNVQPIGIADDFFELGGDSLASVRLLARLDSDFGIKLSEAILSGVSTVEGLAAVLRDGRVIPASSTLVPIQPSGSRAPLFVCLHGDTNSVVSYRQIVRYLDRDQPVLGVRLPDGALSRGTFRTVEEIAANYVETIRARQPSGPYQIIGHSYAGIVAFEVGRQLALADQRVTFLGLIDTACPTVNESRRERLRRHLANLTELGPTAMSAYVGERSTRTLTQLQRRLRTRALSGDDGRVPEADSSTTNESLTTFVLPRYKPQPFSGKVTMFLAADRPRHLQVISQLGWESFATGGWEVREIPGDHRDLVRDADGRTIARAIDACLIRTMTASRA